MYDLFCICYNQYPKWYQEIESVWNNYVNVGFVVMLEDEKLREISMNFCEQTPKLSYYAITSAYIGTEIN
jgi:hypothetical protein